LLPFSGGETERMNIRSAKHVTSMPSGAVIQNKTLRNAVHSKTNKVHTICSLYQVIRRQSNCTKKVPFYNVRQLQMIVIAAFHQSLL
jgi:hypothetical protein